MFHKYILTLIIYMVISMMTTRHNLDSSAYLVSVMLAGAALAIPAILIDVVFMLHMKRKSDRAIP